MELMLTGRTIGAAEAMALGLLTRVVPDASLDKSVREFIGELRTMSAAVVKLTGRALRRRQYADFESDLSKVEQLYLGQLMKTEDAKEGIRAFLEKRPPSWRGR
jgi:cyclohexa-1,5-dienecarbonyl-CoA hydratase